jgi:hypothetical protein
LDGEKEKQIEEYVGSAGGVAWSNKSVAVRLAKMKKSLLESRSEPVK